MRPDKRITFIFVFVLVFVTVFAREAIATDGEITLKEAINIGVQRAKEWNGEATLTGVHTLDETMGGSRGETGKRFKWFVSFVVPDTEEHLLIGISEKKITLVEEIKQSSQPTIPYKEIKLDSSDFLQIAKDKYKLEQGKDWATGFHFTLESVDGMFILTVFGNDRDNHFTRISFNAQNGDVIEAIHKLPYGGGLLSKRGNSENIIKNEMAIRGISAGKEHLLAWGDKKPTQFSITKQPFIEWSHDNGKTWKELHVNHYVTHAWFDMDNRVYAVTEKEVWQDITPKSKGKQILSLDHMIEIVDYSTNNNIAVLSNESIYYTVNHGKSWDEAVVPEPLSAIQITKNGDVIVFTEEKGILQKTKEGWNEISLPDSAGMLTDMKVINNTLFVSGQSGIWAGNLQEEKWRKIHAGELTVALIKKEDKLFGVSNKDEAIYLIDIKEEGKIKKMADVIDLNVWDVDIKGDTLWIATIPKYYWENIEIPK